MLGVGCPAALLLVGTHVDNLDAGEVKLQTFSQTVETVRIAKENRMTNSLLQCRYGSLHHGLVTTLCEDDTLWVQSRGGMEGTRELGFLTKHLLQAILVFIPVGNGLPCHSTLNGSLGDSRGHLSDKAWVNRFRYKIFGAKLQVVDMVNLVDNLWHRLFSQVCYCPYSRKFHLLIDCLGMNVERATENIRESYDIVDLVRIIGPAC